MSHSDDHCPHRPGRPPPLDQQRDYRLLLAQERTESEEQIRRELRRLKGIAATAGATLVGVELAMSNVHWLSALEAGILTPLAVICLLAPVFLDSLQPGWRRHWIRNDFLKNNLILLGVTISILGFGLFPLAFGGGLERVVIDTGAGTGMMGSGIYIAQRFNW